MRLVGRGLFPSVVENMLDAKAELDGRLRTVINEFTDSFATKMTASLPPSSTSSSAPQARQSVHQTCRAVEKEVPNLRRILDDYIPDTRTKETLVGAVQDRVLQLYEDFFDAYTAATKPTGEKNNGKSREDEEVWDLDTFADWSEGVFRVGVAALRSDEDDAEFDDQDSAGKTGSV